MSNAPIESLEQLLRELARERSLRGRLRVLGHSWTLLRSLSPGQREQVALRLGSQWAWKRVEKAFLGDGQLSENEQLVGQAFERMGESDPAELRRLARMIKEGDRKGAQDLLMMTLTEALEEEAEEEEDERGEAAPNAQPESAPEPKTVSEVVDSEEQVLASSLARTVDESSAATLPAPVPAPRSEPKPAQIRAEPAPPPEPQAPPATEPEPAIAETVPPSGCTTLQVLRELQREDRPGRELGPSGRAALIASLGGGWASRRALSRMVTTRSLDGLDEALQLIDGLTRPSQRTWCLADLLAHWELDATEVERVLAAAPSDAARRRLSRRLSRRSRAA